MSKHSVEKLLGARVQALKDGGVYRHLPVLESANMAESIIDGRPLINLASNSYLGLTNHPRVIKASIEATKKFGVGPGAVRTINGNMTVHEELDRVIAEFKHEEAAHHFQSGFSCNAGTIQVLMEKGDLIISDELNHASIIDGVRLSRADKAVYKHGDMNDLERILKEKRAQYNNVLIITDGVFSMDGDLAPLPDLVKVAEQYDALTYVDDAHGSGVLGKSGRGTVDHFGLHGRVDFIIGTLSKGIGVMGGYVAGSQLTYDWLNHRSRTTLFSTTLTPAAAAACIEVFKILSETEEYTKSLWDNAKYFKEKLGTLGFNTGHSETPITPVIIGDEAKSVEFAKRLKEHGIYVSPIIFPTVPKGTGRVRCMIRADHTKDQLDRAVEAFGKVKKEMSL